MSWHELDAANSGPWANVALHHAESRFEFTSQQLVGGELKCARSAVHLSSPDCSTVSLQKAVLLSTLHGIGKALALSFPSA